MFRVPIPGLVAFAEEKTRAEVAAMLHVAKHTTIRVPRVYHWGTAADNPTGLDLPFMIIEYIPHAYDLGTLMAEPELVEHPDLKGDVNLVKEYLFRQLAKMHIQLSQLHSHSISALDMVEDGSFISGAPKTFLLNNQIISYNVPQAVFAPNITTPKTFPTSRQWFLSIAENYIAGLLYDEDLDMEAEDIRSKFVARYLFRQLAQKRKLPQNPDDNVCSTESKNESFRLWCDDFRPHNMLCNEKGEVQGVIDWEFVYFAPESYIYDPPYWLFIDRDPEDPPDDQDDESVHEQEIAEDEETDGDTGSHEQDEDAEGIADGAVTNRCDFNLEEDVERNRQLFMRALQLEERELYEDRRQMPRENGSTKSQHQCEGLAEQLSGLSTTDKDATPTPLYDRMTKRWEEQRNEFVWNFTYRWDRDEFDAWYWDELDQEHGGKSGDYRDRLDLLPQHVKDLMEWFVHNRVEERDQWDPRKLMDAVLGQMDGTGPFVTAVDRTSENGA